MDIQAFLDNLIFLSLLVVTIVYWASVTYTDFKILKKLSFYGTVFVNFLIFVLLSLRWLNFGYFPLSNLYESLLFLAWGITFITIIIEDRVKLSLIGSISTPIALFISGFAGLSLPESMQAPASLVPALKSNWLMMHVTVMMLSYAALLVGSLLAILFLILVNGKKENITLQGNSYGRNYSDYQTSLPETKLTSYYKEEESLDTYPNFFVSKVSNKNPNIARLSLLESIDNLSYRTISFGFPLLTIGIVAGAV